MRNTVIQYLKYFHGLYNSFIILMFLYQGWLGLKIRKGRFKGKPPEIKNAKRHRKLGSFLVFMGIAGFFVGMSIGYLHAGHIFGHTLHFLNGLAISVLIGSTFFISQKIKGRESAWRTPHFVLGILIICLYLIQAFLGLNMLF